MADKTEISWTDATWSPWEGCTKVSPGCDNCYAEGMNRWLRKGENWGPGAARRVYGSDHWEKPLKWQKRLAAAGARMKVFPSVCDPFDNEVAPVIRARFFALMMTTPNIDWLLLTKRIGNAAKMLAAPGMPKEPLPNAWIGATVVNQAEADRDIPKLLVTPARLRFLSIEPMLGPIDLRWTFADSRVLSCPICGFRTNEQDHGPCPNDGETLKSDVGVDWVIAGGESGRGARPAHPDWFRSLRNQCAAAGVPFHFKQHGEWLATDFATDEQANMPHRGIAYVAQDGRWSNGDHGVDFFGGDRQTVWIGKKTAGRLLDGVEHNDFPEVP